MHGRQLRIVTNAGRRGSFKMSQVIVKILLNLSVKLVYGGMVSLSQESEVVLVHKSF